MDKTSNLQLPFMAPSQAQKHVTHNDALLALDALIQLSAISQSMTLPPSSLNEGDRFIVGANGTDEWLGKDNQIAAWQDGSWMFYTPQEGWLCWVEDEDLLLVWNGNDWGSAGSGGTASTNPTSLVGVNATADLTNRLSVNSPATLLNHEGSDHQLKVNKNTETDTASLLFQTGFSGRAEMGLTGDDNFHLKVSGDGSNWTDVMRVRDGFLTIPNRPSFRASPSASQTFQNDAQNLIFDTVLENNGGHYNQSNSTFTAPTEGHYLFTATARFDGMPSGSWARLFLRRNSSNENFQLGHSIIGNNHSTDYDNLSLSSILFLHKNDVISLCGGRSGGSGWLQQESSWSGIYVG